MYIPLSKVDSLLGRANHRIRTLALTASKADLKEGRQWYDKAHVQAYRISKSRGLSLERACALIACLSPSVSWSRNIIDADQLAGNLEWRCSTYQRQVDKAIDLLTGAEIDSALGGKKVRAFYECILNPDHETSVVIDRHATRTALGIWDDKDAGYAASRRYDELSDCYRKVANERSELPLHLQATVWLLQRRT